MNILKDLEEARYWADRLYAFDPEQYLEYMNRVQLHEDMRIFMCGEWRYWQEHGKVPPWGQIYTKIEKRGSRWIIEFYPNLDYQFEHLN